ncbi:hypothetical protein Dgeo_2921 (plasmid) [Deinococcus geothermalis DSM 11300]|uniref:Uncharacterized protein n=1 Tax=Deinococcus geothermalis (strain DSM 11300 / CIP 105573 / AG-3a) TaxID=319795 RepID=A8ZR55_DEIGD|nr:hypothetical protein Dgeo_2921 [Deinococcus geothermalis DSM 11300]
MQRGQDRLALQQVFEERAELPLVPLVDVQLQPFSQPGIQPFMCVFRKDEGIEGHLAFTLPGGRFRRVTRPAAPGRLAVDGFVFGVHLEAGVEEVPVLDPVRYPPPSALRPHLQHVAVANRSALEFVVPVVGLSQHPFANAQACTLGARSVGGAEDALSDLVEPGLGGGFEHVAPRGGGEHLLHPGPDCVDWRQAVENAAGQLETAEVHCGRDEFQGTGGLSKAHHQFGDVFVVARPHPGRDALQPPRVLVQGLGVLDSDTAQRGNLPDAAGMGRLGPSASIVRLESGETEG